MSLIVSQRINQRLTPSLQPVSFDLSQFAFKGGQTPGLNPFPKCVSVIAMSATEILEELPNLNPAELETIYRRAVELHRGQTVAATPQLLAAIDEAEESFAREGGVGMNEARRIVASWNTK